MSTTPQEISGLQGLLGQNPAPASGTPSPIHPGLPGSVSTQELGGLQTLLSAKDAPEPSPEEQQSKTRQMLVSGLTGMPTPVMNDQDKAEFARGKAAGAVSVPLVAGATAGATAGASALLPAVLPHTVAGIKAIGTWAEANPAKAYGLFLLLKEMVPGFKKAVGIVSHAPTE